MIPTCTPVGLAGDGTDGYGGWRIGFPAANANADAGKTEAGTRFRVPSASLAA